MDRKRMMELVDEHMGKSPGTRPDKKDNQRTGRQTLKLLLADDEPEPQEPEPPVQPKIILYLRDDVNPAEKNFTKTPNEMYDLTASRLTSHETVLYMWTWRISWGFSRNYCRFSRKQVLEKTSINSESSVRRAISGLREKQFIIQVLDEHEKPDLNKSGSLYRICSPSEIVSGTVEEGILLKDIPIEGVYCTWLNMNRVNKSRTIMNQVQYEPSQIEPGHNEPPNKPNKSRSNMNPQDGNPDDIKGSGKSGQIEPGQVDPPLKDRPDLKDSLSQEGIISHFYDCIGQKNVTRKKREGANRCLEELLTEGYSLEDIQFAVDWTVRHTEKKLYDFSIIEHTISQAMSEKEKMDRAEADRQEKIRIKEEERLKEEQTAKESEELENYKKSLSSREREILRHRALEEIKKMKGVKEEFVTEHLISAKENEILKSERNI